MENKIWYDNFIYMGTIIILSDFAVMKRFAVSIAKCVFFVPCLEVFVLWIVIQCDLDKTTGWTSYMVANQLIIILFCHGNWSLFTSEPVSYHQRENPEDVDIMFMWGLKVDQTWPNPLSKLQKFEIFITVFSRPVNFFISCHWTTWILKFK